MKIEACPHIAVSMVNTDRDEIYNITGKDIGATLKCLHTWDASRHHIRYKTDSTLKLDEDYEAIDWKCSSDAIDRLSDVTRTRIQKFIHGWLPTGVGANAFCPMCV